MLKDLLKPKRLSTVMYCVMILNTKGKKMPMYLVHYLSEKVRETNGVLDVRVIYDLTSNIAQWRKVYKEIVLTDTIFQIMFTLNVEDLDFDEFSKYMGVIVEEDIFPFIFGCNFDIVNTYMHFTIEDKYKNVTTEGGDTSIVIYSDKMLPKIETMLSEVFKLDKFKVDEVASYFDMLGQYKIEKCLSLDKVSDAEEILKKLNVKYIIE